LYHAKRESGLHSDNPMILHC